MLEMLPTPWGLVRSGVAPDHPKIKSISAQFEKTALDPRFRFFGNIVVGDHVQAAELAERYDAVIYAVGAQSDRSLGIPGEDLPGSVPAVDFVGWYNAHPHFEEMAPDLSTRAGRRRRQRQRRAGRGAHPGHRSRRAGDDRHRRPRAAVAARPRRRGGRSSSAGAARCRPPFTTLELRELGHLEGLGDVDVIVDPADFADISDEDVEAAGKTVKNNIKVLRGYAEADAEGRQAPDRVPVPHVADRDQGRRTGSSPSCWAATSWSTTTAASSPRTPASARRCPRSWWCARSATAACRLPGLPFDDRSGTIPHTDGRIEGSRNEYVVGWIKRGPTGVIGSNKSDSQDTVDTLLADLSGADARGLRRGPCRAAGGVAAGAAAEAGHRRPLEADRRPRTLSRRAARPAAGEADQRRRPAAHRPRLTVGRPSRGQPARLTDGGAGRRERQLSGFFGEYMTGKSWPIVGHWSTSIGQPLVHDVLVDRRPVDDAGDRDELLAGRRRGAG